MSENKLKSNIKYSVALNVAIAYDKPKISNWKAKDIAKEKCSNLTPTLKLNDALCFYHDFQESTIYGMIIFTTRNLEDLINLKTILEKNEIYEDLNYEN